jgi:hypothetical protein
LNHIGRPRILRQKTIRDVVIITTFYADHQLYTKLCGGLDFNSYIEGKLNLIILTPAF